MKRILTTTALAGMLFAAGLQAQTPSTAPPEPGAQQESDATAPHQSARSFEGRIARSGNQFVLLDRAAQTTYKLDDQQKARKFEGKDVKVMAIMDNNTNVLRVIDINPSKGEQTPSSQ
jgi:Protein of unknown function (DUF5818)